MYKHEIYTKKELNRYLKMNPDIAFALVSECGKKRINLAMEYRFSKCLVTDEGIHKFTFDHKVQGDNKLYLELETKVRQDDAYEADVESM